MERQDFTTLLNRAWQHVESLTNTLANASLNAQWYRLNQKSSDFRANEDASIYQHLHHSFDGLLAPLGFERIEDDQGHKITLKRESLELEVTVTHRAIGIEDVQGVDIMYNVDGWKSIAFQHKKRDEKGRFDFSSKERRQREKIRRLCGVCEAASQIPRLTPYLNEACSSAYVIGGGKGPVRHVVSACQVEEYRRAHMKLSDDQLSLPLKSEIELSDIEHSDKLFLLCLLGKKHSQQERDDAKKLREELLNRNDVVIEATLNGWTQSRRIPD